MEISEEAKLDMKNALNGKLSDNYDELKIVQENLAIKKAEATSHGTYKQIDKAMDKITHKMNKLKA
ncbi:hypothetical protein GJV85_11705 [Sulfurimonas aquatica]|uniref:Uncharacterized protein n=1 Tax=Sulfurimonas aquatica TaxID=2672570 RepID=A0A975B272_9BACT|nr:hypothetical protein [Sulfurimonas aquatica]QSZ42750.1 hypothetical protein GJV85_11705 [Sulfurimonas aquatica]